MSIHSIAKLAGVSTATVSRVLNEQDVVTADTVAKVRRAMKDIGYKPAHPSLRRGPKASPFARLKHRTIAFLWIGTRGPASFPPTELPPGADPDLPVGGEPIDILTRQALLEGASGALGRHRLNLTVDYTADHPGELPTFLDPQRVDGVLIQGSVRDETLAAKLRSIPTVGLLYRGRNDWADRVQPDHRAVGRKSLEYLAGKNCRHVCCMTYRPVWPSDRYYTERADAFQQFAQLAGIRCDMIGEDVDEPGGSRNLFEVAEKMVQQFVQLSPRPTGLLVANNLGYYVHEHLRRAGIKIGQELQCICGDQAVVYQHLEPEPVKVNIHPQDIGRLGVDLLLMRINNPNAPQSVLMVEPTLVVPGR